MTTHDKFISKIEVPLEGVYDYTHSSTWNPYKPLIEYKISGPGKKSNCRKSAKSYRKFAKRMKKAIKYLPEGIEVVVRAERK